MSVRTGVSSTSMIAVMAQTSEIFTLNECAKLLTFSKFVIVDKYKMLDALYNAFDSVVSYMVYRHFRKTNIQTK